MQLSFAMPVSGLVRIRIAVKDDNPGVGGKNRLLDQIERKCRQALALEADDPVARPRPDAVFDRIRYELLLAAKFAENARAFLMKAVEDLLRCAGFESKH